MIKYRIITDSSSGISPDEADKLGITVLPLNLEYKGEMYRDGIDISTDEFYEKLFSSDEQKKFMLARFMEKKEMPKSTLVSPALFEEEFQKCKDNSRGTSGYGRRLYPDARRRIFRPFGIQSRNVQFPAARNSSARHHSRHSGDHSRHHAHPQKQEGGVVHEFT